VRFIYGKTLFEIEIDVGHCTRFREDGRRLLVGIAMFVTFMMVRIFFFQVAIGIGIDAG